MLSIVWDLIKFGFVYYLFIAFFAFLWLNIDGVFPHLIYIVLVGYVTVVLFLRSNLAERIIILIPIAILIAKKFIIPKLFERYKIYALKTMNKVIKKYTKKYGFTAPWKFGDRYLAVKYKYRYAFFEYSGPIIRKYYPVQLDAPNKASYVDIIGAHYICTAIQYYRQCVLCYALQIDNIKDISLKNCTPRNISYRALLDSKQLSGLSDFIKGRDGMISECSTKQLQLNIRRDLKRELLQNLMPSMSR